MEEKNTFRTLPDALKEAKDPLLLIEGKGGIVSDLNLAFEEFLGDELGDLRGSFFDELFDPERSWAELKRTVMEAGCFRTGPLSLKGSERSFYLNIHPLFLGEGEDPFFGAHVDGPQRDLTEVLYGKGNGKNIEDGGVHQYLDEIIYHFGFAKDGSIDPLYISPRIQEIFGIDVHRYVEELRNGTLDERIHPLNVQEVREARSKVYEKRTSVSLTYRVFPEGVSEPIWVKERIHPRFDKNGEHVETMGVLRDVTEQVVVERRLIQREKHFRNLFENNLAGVFRTGPDRTIVSCNDAFVKMLGAENEDELIGRSIEDIYDSSTDKGSFVRKVLENDGLTGHESKVFLRDGKPKYFIENVSPVRDENGEVKFLDGTIIDITELKETNRALRDSEERYRTLVDAAVDSIFVWEWETGRIVNANQSASRLLKLSVDDLIGKALGELFPEEKKNPWKELLNRYKDHQDPSLINEDSAILDQEGERIPVEVNARAFELRGERYVIGLFRDISQWVESQRALRDSEERFRLLSESTVEGIVMSKEGRIIDINDQFARIFGYEEREGLIGKELCDLLHPEYKEKGMEGGEGGHFQGKREVKAVRKDGEVIDVEVQGEFLPYHGEEVRVTVVHDITQRKRIEEELRERERAMSTLLGNLPGIAYRCYNDPDWTMEFMSEGVKELLGLRPEQLIGNREYSYAELILEEDRDKVWSAVQEGLEKGKSFDVQYRVRTADGSIKTFWEKGEAVGTDEESGETILEGFITDVSTRVEYERELEQSQARYRDLIENSPYGTILHKEGEILYVNERAKQLFGLNELQDAPSMRIFDYIDPEYQEQVKERMERVMGGEDLPFIELVVSMPDSEQRIELETKIDLIEYEGEKVFHTAFREITRQKQLEREMMRAQVAEEYNKQLEQEIQEHKQTQKKLHDSQKFARNIIDSSLDMIIATDQEGRITVFNEAAENEFGYTREEVLEQQSSILFAERDEQVRILRAIEEEGGFTGEIKNLDRNGREFLTYLSAAKIKDHRGEEIGSMGISRDITEIKEAEEELRRSEEKYRAIYDQAYIGIAQVDLDGYFLNVNQQWCEISGYSDEELKGAHFNSLTAPEYREMGETFREELKAKRKDRVSFEKQNIHKDGSRIDLNVTVATVKDREGEPDYFVSVFEDITERKRNEQELVRSLREKEVLLREVHHRVKNNLQVISSILNLQTNFVDDENTLQILRESQNRIGSMSFIHESLYRTDEFASIDLAQYVKELSTNLHRSYYKNGDDIQLEHELENVDLDLDQAIPCGLIINELLSNALKYAFPEGQEGKVHIGVHEEEKEDGNMEVKIRIADNGVGLPEGYEIGESDSLGLQLVSSLLEQIGGEIRLKRDNGTDHLITFEKR